MRPSKALVKTEFHRYVYWYTGQRLGCTTLTDLSPMYAPRYMYAGLSNTFTLYTKFGPMYCSSEFTQVSVTSQVFSDSVTSHQTAQDRYTPEWCGGVDVCTHLLSMLGEHAWPMPLTSRPGVACPRPSDSRWGPPADSWRDDGSHARVRPYIAASAWAPPGQGLAV